MLFGGFVCEFQTSPLNFQPSGTEKRIDDPAGIPVRLHSEANPELELLALHDYDGDDHSTLNVQSTRALTADRRFSARMNYRNSLSGPELISPCKFFPLDLGPSPRLQPPGGLD
ncbi:hypothetical protein BDW75DRAFT_120832 [Aspergillus navahoensis]